MQGPDNSTTPIRTSVSFTPKEEALTKEQAADKARNKINMYASALGNAKGHTVTVDGKTMPIATAVHKMMKAYRTLSVNESLTKEEKALVKDRITFLKEEGAISHLDYKILELQRKGASWVSKELTKLGYLGKPKNPSITIEEEDDKNQKKAPDRTTVTVSKENDLDDAEFYLEKEDEKPKSQTQPPEGKGKEKIKGEDDVDPFESWKNQ